MIAPASRLVLLGLCLALAGCGGTAEALGLGRNPPDAFAVVDRPPLSMPPDFDLRPPRPGAPRPQEINMTRRADQILLKSAANATTEASSSEKALLASAGTNKAEAGIRDLIDREAADRVVGSKRLIDEVLWWRKDETPATTVDAGAEAARLKEAKEKGETPTSGATPIIEKGKSGWLGL